MERVRGEGGGESKGGKTRGGSGGSSGRPRRPRIPAHSGWNSVTEAALRRVRMLAWPHLSDLRICAMLMEKSGVGEWANGGGTGRRLAGDSRR